MYTSSKLFTMSIIAALSKRGIKTIRFDNDSFNDAVESMQHYFLNNRDDFGLLSCELSTLFIRDSSGNFSRFHKALEHFNEGHTGLLAFDNPYYVSAHIEASIDADAILQANSRVIPINMVNGFTDAYINGLHV